VRFCLGPGGNRLWEEVGQSSANYNQQVDACNQKIDILKKLMVDGSPVRSISVMISKFSHGDGFWHTL
jgi:hypothetical protein